LRPLARAMNEVKEHFNPKDYNKWLEPIGKPGDAWYMRGDINSLIKTALKFQKIKEEYRDQLIQRHEATFGEALTPEKVDELNFFQGGVAITYANRGHDAPIPELNDYVYQSKGVYHASRLGDRSKEVLSHIQNSVLQTEHKDKRLPFHVFIHQGEIYNNGFLMTQEAVRVFVQQHVVMAETKNGLSPLRVEVPYVDLNAQIKERFGFCPEMDPITDGHLTLRFILTPAKEDDAVYYIRYVGTASNLKGVETSYDIYELIAPSEDPNSFWSLFHTHHGLPVLEKNRYRLKY